MQDFYISIPSNTLTEGGYNSENKTSDFRIKLPEEINLVGDNWEVALVELQYPFSWNNISEVETSSDLKQNEIEVVTNLARYKIKVVIPDGYYSDAEALEAILFKVFDQSMILEYNKKQVAIDLKSLIWFSWDKIRNKFILIANDPENNLFSIRMSPHIQYMLGFKHQVYRISDTFKEEAAFPPDLRAGIDSLFVYCDIIEPQIIGNNRAQVLRIVPVTGDYGSVIDKVFIAPHYVSVLNKNFSSIHVSIKTDQNRLFQFTSGKCIVKLHFKKSRKFQI